MLASTYKRLVEARMQREVNKPIPNPYVDDLIRP